MALRRLGCGSLVRGPLPLPGLAQAPAPLPLLANGSTAALAESLRGVILNALPDPLYEASPGWGNQVNARFGGGRENHGKWRKIPLTAHPPPQTIPLHI